MSELHKPHKAHICEDQTYSFQGKGHDLSWDRCSIISILYINIYLAILGSAGVMRMRELLSLSLRFIKVSVQKCWFII